MVDNNILCEAFYKAVLFQNDESFKLIDDHKNELRKKNNFLVRGSYSATPMDADTLYNAITGFHFESIENFRISTREVKDLTRFLSEDELCYAITYSEEVCFNASRFISYFSEKRVPNDIYLKISGGESESHIEGFIFQKDMADALNLGYTELNDNLVYVKDYSLLRDIAPTPRGFSRKLDELDTLIGTKKMETLHEVGRVKIVLD